MPMNEILTEIKGTNPIQVFTATQSVRKLLSKERNPPIDRVIEAGLVDTLVKFLEMNDKYVIGSAWYQPLKKRFDQGNMLLSVICCVTPVKATTKHTKH